MTRRKVEAIDPSEYIDATQLLESGCWRERIRAKPDRPIRAVPFERLLPGKPATPPCKSEQLEKDLGLEVSSARQAARLIIIFEVMRSFFVGSSASVPHGTRTILTRHMMRCGLTSADLGLQLGPGNCESGVPAKVQPHGQLSPAKDAVKRRVT